MMTKQPRVSIIVGLYNVEKFLREHRLEDIYNQTFTDWELILVDDGSTDGTSVILDAEAKNDKRINVIHKENGGLGSARNAGLDVAQGKYIWSFDVDDRVDSDALAKLYSTAEETNAEVLCFGYTEHNVALKTHTQYQFERITCNSNEEVRAIYLDHLLLRFNNGFFWNKLYRRDFIEKNHLRFGNERIQQDEVFNIKVYKCLNHLGLIPGTYYHYYVYNTGNNRSRFIPNRYEIYKSVFNQFCELKKHWDLNDEHFNGYLNNRLFSNLNDLLRYNLTHPKCTWSRDERICEMDRIMNDDDFIGAIAFKEKEGFGFENKLYVWVYRNRSFILIVLLNCFFSFLRNIKHTIKLK